MISLFRCPLCGGVLTRDEHACRCAARHSFDVAKEGYVNLLPVQQKNSKAPGDDKEMSIARREFLSKGHYGPLLLELQRQITAEAGDSPVVLDTGCGEGYYTAGVYQALREAGKTPHMAGIDISKYILRSAAKRERDIEFAVASSYHLPLADESVDILLNCFSPLALEEFRRVLKPGGLFLYVVPAAEHLWEMKEVLYDEPYRNEEKLTPYEGFAYERVAPVESVMELDAQNLKNLFGMTPYAWKTPRVGRERLLALEHLTVRASFRIHIYRREDN